jgi:Ricin-type beta-trefoil lectin domain
MTYALRRRFRPARESDDGFAMIFALMFILFIGTFSLLLLSQVTSEVSQTQFANKHEQTVNTALAGLNAGLSQLRNAVDPTTGAGVKDYLPCSPLSGTVNASATQTWQTTIYYLNVDPTDMTLAQVQAVDLPCPLASVPTYAYLLASGRQATLNGHSAAFGDRTLHATYFFTQSNADNVGGQVVYGANCWDVGSTPAPGTRVTFQPCLAPGTLSQSWYYRPDLSLFWEGNPALKLCLDYRSFATGASVKYMTLETCLGTGVLGSAYNASTDTYQPAGKMYQEYSSNAAWNNVVAGGDRSGACINSYTSSSGSYGNGAVGDQLTMATSCGGAAGALATAAVGSGAAGGFTNGTPGPTSQLVNLAYASRCLDVQGSNPANGQISYPCHQAPDTTLVEGNQQYQYAGPAGAAGTIQTFRPGFYSTVCFDSIGGVANLLACVPGKPTQQWIMTGPIVGDYARSYLIKDYNGQCLQAVNPSGLLVGNTSVVACDGSDSQKWNAPPGGEKSLLRAVGEQ